MRPSSEDTIFGQLEWQGKLYGVLKSPFDEKRWQLIAKYKEKHPCNMRVFPVGGILYYFWTIEDGMLYLKEARCGFHGESEKINVQDIFGEEAHFVNWFSGELRVVVTIRSLGIVKSTHHKERDLLVLRFDEGCLAEQSHITEQYSVRHLKNYIED